MLKVIYNNLQDDQHPKTQMKSGACGPRGESCTKCTNVITHTLVMTSGQTWWHQLQMNWPDSFESMKVILLLTWGCVSAMERLTKKMFEQAEECGSSSHTPTKASAVKSQPWSVQEKGYQCCTPSMILWFILCDHEEVGW